MPRPVLITGCSSGIGLATTTYLAERGTPVFATVRRDDDRERVGAIPNVEAFVCDVTDDGQVAALRSAIDERGDGLWCVGCARRCYRRQRPNRRRHHPTHRIWEQRECATAYGEPHVNRRWVRHASRARHGSDHTAMGGSRESDRVPTRLSDQALRETSRPRSV